MHTSACDGINPCTITPSECQDACSTCLQAPLHGPACPKRTQHAASHHPCSPKCAHLCAAQVLYNNTDSSYYALYDFTVDNAWHSPDRITYRYLLCLWNDTSTSSIRQLAGASFDVVR